MTKVNVFLRAIVSSNTASVCNLRQSTLLHEEDDEIGLFDGVTQWYAYGYFL